MGPLTYTWNCDKVKNRVIDPKWREKIANKEDASNPYSITYAVVEAPDVKFRALGRDIHGTLRWYTHEGWPLTVQPALPKLTDTNSVKGAAVAKFYQKYADTIHPAKGLVMLAEFKDTRLTACSLLLDAIKLYNALRRDVRGLWIQLRAEIHRFRSYPAHKRKRLIRRAYAQAEKDLASRYLQFTFGIEPLVSDIEATYTVMCEEMTERVYINASVKDNSLSTVNSELGYCNNYVLVNIEKTTTNKIRSKCRGAVDIVKPANPNSLEGSAVRMGVTLREVVPALWEATPYSFLVDYFVNVSHLLTTALYADAKFTYANQSTVADIRVTYATKGFRQGSTSGKLMEANIPRTSVVLKRFSFVREQVKPSNASIRFSIPPLGRKWLNMVALAVGRLPKSR